MTVKVSVKLSANFERTLDAVEDFLLEAGVPQAFDALIDELTGTVIPNLERFPSIGRPFIERPLFSVETSNGVDGLRQKLAAIAQDGDLREYVLTHYLLLYARFDATIYLLSIRHHRQLSFDFESLWQR